MFEHLTDYFDLRSLRGQKLLLIIISLISILIPFLPQERLNFTLPKSWKFSKNECLNNSQTNINCKNCRFYSIYGKSATEDHLKHVKAVLERLGYIRASLNEDWHIMWAHDFPFRTQQSIVKNLKPYQKVNHFPGTGFITNKVDLSVSDLPYIPKSFRFPNDKQKFISYSKEHPKKHFVEKHNQHRHIVIKSIEEMSLNSNHTFIQEFIDRPFLIDGYKFDMGVYVIITSVNPLRAYIYNGDVLFRYCTVKYYPFDSKNTKKYVVGDDYLPTWEVPSLKKFVSLGYGMKDSFDAYIESKGSDPRFIWNQVEDLIRKTLLLKEKHIITALKSYKTKRNFFEMMRFDLVINEDLKVFLIEANMSPNLSSAHFKQNSLLYEQIIYSLLNLVGIASPINQSYKRFSDVDKMLVSEKNLVINASICSKKFCLNSCDSNECCLCLPCLTDEDVEELKFTFQEHMQKTDIKRIFPVPITDIKEYNIEHEIDKLSPQNKFLTRWFYEKCKINISWCS